LHHSSMPARADMHGSGTTAIVFLILIYVLGTMSGTATCTVNLYRPFAAVSASVRISAAKDSRRGRDGYS
jgi:hypothetical protein